MYYFNERCTFHVSCSCQYPSKNADRIIRYPRTKEVIPLSVLADPRVLRVAIHRELFEIPVQEILFIEVFNWKCLIHRLAGEPIGVNMPLKALAEELSGPSFIRCGRSFLVNLDHLSRVTADSLILRGGRVIPVPRRERAELLPYCTQFLTSKK